MTDIIQEMRGLIAKATPGPYLIRTLENFGFNVVHYQDGDKFNIVRVGKCADEANADLIVAAINHLPAPLDRLEAAERGWQPIETAPHMREILLWADTSVPPFDNWRMASGYFHSEMKVWVWGGEQVREWAFPPTHWRPLPDAPAIREVKP